MMQTGLDTGLLPSSGIRTRVRPHAVLGGWLIQSPILGNAKVAVLCCVSLHAAASSRSFSHGMV